METHYGANVTLECVSESFPKGNHTWMKDGDRITDGIAEEITYERGEYVTYSRLHMSNIDRRDYGDYMCGVRNMIGEADTFIQLSGK